jgi:RNA polymerase sigma-70 factor (ECF subfamily)
VVTVPPLRVLPLPNEPDLAEAVDAEGEGASWATDAPCDRAALAALYSELAPAVLRFLRDLLGDDALAADALQEAFVRAFRRVESVPHGTRLAAWVFGIARNVSLELRKARGRARRVLVEEDARLACRVADLRARSPEAQLLDREAVVVVTGALAQLPEDRRAALLLRLDHGLSYDEIARAMGWSLSKVKVEIFRAREVLRATFDAYRGGVP